MQTVIPAYNYGDFMNFSTPGLCMERANYYSNTCSYCSSTGGDGYTTASYSGSAVRRNYLITARTTKTALLVCCVARQLQKRGR